MGTALNGVIRAKFRLGVKDYSVGNHPLWQLSRSVYQITQRPYLLGGFALGGWIRLVCDSAGQNRDIAGAGGVCAS